MMKSALVLALLLLATSAYGASLQEENYIVIVGQDAPASDVVIAANFAASMKGSVAVTFVSALDSDAREQVTDLYGKTIVIINGQERLVRIIGTSNAAVAANAYFTQQGFVVREVQKPTLDDLYVTRPPVLPRTAPAGTTANATITANVSARTEVAQQQSQQPMNRAQAAQEPAETEERNPGVLTRIRMWFSRLFS